MAKIIDNRSQMDQTVRIFDSFYSTDLVVSSNNFDVVYGYFKEVCPNKDTAENFTALFFRIAQEANINAVSLLEIIQGAPTKIKLNEIMAYYLNSFKSKTSLYGIGVVPKPNQSVARNVVL